MTAGSWSDVRIRSSRFELRPLTEADVTERYLSWFSNRGASRIGQHPTSLDDLRAYVGARSSRPDVLFLAIRTAGDGLHIGNLKFEPIDHTRGGAIVGIFIGDETWQGRGVATETIRTAAHWLHTTLGLRYLWLGVAEDNLAARRAYEKVGFDIRPCYSIPARSGVLTMELDLIPEIRR